MALKGTSVASPDADDGSARLALRAGRCRGRGAAAGVEHGIDELEDGALIGAGQLFKKSTRGIATPRREIDLIKERYRWARAHHAANYANHVGSQEEEEER